MQVFDSWAAELSPVSFREFSLPYLRHISEHLPRRLQEMGRPRVPMTVFAKGAWYALDALCDAGYDVVGLDWLQDPAEAVRIARGRVVLQGNADPGVLYGGKEAISRAVRDMVSGFGGGKQGWIANLGHGRANTSLTSPMPPLGNQPFQKKVADANNNMSGVTPGVDPDDLAFFFTEIKRLTGSSGSGGNSR